MAMIDRIASLQEGQEKDTRSSIKTGIIPIFGEKGTADFREAEKRVRQVLLARRGVPLPGAMKTGTGSATGCILAW